MRVTIVAAWAIPRRQTTMSMRRSRAHHEAGRGLPRGAAPLKGPEARAAPRGRHTTRPKCHSEEWVWESFATVLLFFFDMMRLKQKVIYLNGEAT